MKFHEHFQIRSKKPYLCQKFYLCEARSWPTKVKKIPYKGKKSTDLSTLSTELEIAGITENQVSFISKVNGFLFVIIAVVLKND